MKKIFLKPCILFLMFVSPTFLFSQLCLTFTNFSGSQSISKCIVALNWSYNQCTLGTYYIEYSTDAVNFNAIASIKSNTQTNI